MKPLFDGTDDLYADISMGFDLVTKTEPSIGLDEGNMTFTKEELKKHVFDPVIQEVVGLCRDLQKDTHNLKAIFMVGGFGSSAYLYSQMEQEFAPQNIRIVQPDRPGNKRAAAAFSISNIQSKYNFFYRNGCGSWSCYFWYASYKNCYTYPKMLVWH